VLERFYAIQRRFYAGEDAGADLRALLADDVVWHVPGRSAIAGEYRGLEQVLAYFAVRREIADKTFRITSRGALADSDRVVHFADGEALIGGELRRWRTVGIFNISDGLIAECWLLPFDQYQFDEIWDAPSRTRT
jgi:ketosteroid isomerase-like protein